MVIVFLGPPGSGKGTQAKKLSKAKGWPHLSTGDMFRTAIANGTDVGKKAKAIMDRGELVSDEVVIALIQEHIQQKNCQNGFILDGFPRTIEQAKALNRLLKNQSLELNKSIYFNMNEKALIERLSGRRTCLKCGAMYHMISQKPQIENKCDQCGHTPLVQRDDDKKEVIEKRLKVYQEQTAPLVSFYKEQGVLVTIDASLLPESVEKSIEEVIGS